MPVRVVRAAIVGASSLIGKELAEELNAPSATLWDISLFDSGEAGGQIASAGDEALVIQPLSADSFQGMDIAFFAGDTDETRAQWRTAQAAGSGIVDLTGALEGEPGIHVMAPLLSPAAGAVVTALDLATVGLVSAHPVAIMLGAAAVALRTLNKEVRLAATVLEPASQHGSAGLDEMHAQTVSLLSFQSVPKDVFDAQVAFNMNAELGSGSKVDLATVSQRIRRHLQAVLGTDAENTCALQLVQAPVFNGYTASVFCQAPGAVEVADVERVLQSALISLPGTDEDGPSNQSATQQGQVLMRVSAEPASAPGEGSFWLWMAADNLRLAARNAVACAADLMTVRPVGRVQ